MRIVKKRRALVDSAARNLQQALHELENNPPKTESGQVVRQLIHETLGELGYEVRR